MPDHAPGLDSETGRLALDYLGLAASEPPDLAFLNRLVRAYTQRVPWESATRIARRAMMKEENNVTLDSYPRWPAEFWRLAMEQGGGGTCYESNYAFFSLLITLGYKGYLTINNMGASIGCHSAIVVILAGEKWLVDVGFPLYVPLPLNPLKTSGRESPFHGYMLRPDGQDCYQVGRDRHPQPNCFTLIDLPVPEDRYRAITVADYSPSGFFLDRLVITRVIEDTVWRFDSAERPYRLESFWNGLKAEFPIEDQGRVIDQPAAALAERFRMPVATISLALAAVNKVPGLANES